MKTYGLILAGGKSSRFNGEDKSWTLWNKQPLINHVINRIRPQVDNLLISANRNFEKYAQLGYPVVSDELENYQGPLAGIAAAMKYISAHNTDINNIFILTAPCDMPLIPEDLLELLTQSGDPANNSDQISVASDGNRTQSLIALIPLTKLEHLTTFLESGQRKVEQWILDSKPNIIDLSDHANNFYNINNLDELDKLDTLSNTPKGLVN